MKASDQVFCTNDEPGWLTKQKLLSKQQYTIIRTITTTNGRLNVEVEGLEDHLWDASRFTLIQIRYIAIKVDKTIFEQAKGLIEN